jgi:YD repeat-containing protein
VQDALQYGGGVTSTYDAAFRRVRLDAADGAFETYTYDTASRVSAVGGGMNLGSDPGTCRTSLNYDKDTTHYPFTVTLDRYQSVAYFKPSTPVTATADLLHADTYDGASRLGTRTSTYTGGCASWRGRRCGRRTAADRSRNSVPGMYCCRGTSTIRSGRSSQSWWRKCSSATGEC